MAHPSTLFDSRIGFSGTMDQIDLLAVAPDRRWPLATILEFSNHDISLTGHPINFVFDSVAAFYQERVNHIA